MASPSWLASTAFIYSFITVLFVNFFDKKIINFLRDWYGRDDNTLL